MRVPVRVRVRVRVRVSLCLSACVLMSPRELAPTHTPHPYALASHVRTKKKIEAGGMMAPKDMIGAGLAKFKNARDDSSSGGGDSDEWSDSD